MLAPQALLDIPPPCRPSGSQTCAGVWDLTHNAFLARSAEWVIGKPLAIIGLLVLAWVLRWVANRVIDRLVRRAAEGVLPGRLHGLRRAEDDDRPAPEPAGTGRRAQRARSLGSLGKSIASGLIYGIIFVMILAQIGVNIAPIIASAGVVGVAVGFGAQSLVKDFLSGIFLTLEDQYGVGDSIDLGDVSGTVEAIGLRVTRLRDVNGTVWYVRNGEILRVGNQSQNWARTVIDVSVAYSANLARVREVLRDVSHDLWEDPRFQGVIIEEPEVWGVQSMSAEGIVVRVTLKTAPLEQWRVAREMRERVKDRFEAEGIEMPVAQRVLWPGQTNPGATDGEDAS